jgi:hypothetical protein
MRVVLLEPGDEFREESAEIDPSELQPTVWYFKVVLDDHGIDPA